MPSARARCHTRHLAFFVSIDETSRAIAGGGPSVLRRKVRTPLLNEAEKPLTAAHRHDLGGCKPNRPVPVSRAL